MSKPSLPEDPEVAQRARRLTQSRNAIKSGRALGELGLRALPALQEALAHANAFVRSGALHGLAAISPPSADTIGSIANALTTDLDPRVRETACLMLARLDPGAIASTREVLTRAATDSDERVRAAAAQALARI